MVPLSRLVDAALWAHDVEELAEECWVYVETMQCRLNNLTNHERMAVPRALAERDFHEEGMA